jgi:uncharacterized membrane protein YgcG
MAESTTSYTINNHSLGDIIMRKSAWFLSAALTAFVITILAGVVYAYNGLSFTNLLTFQSSQTTQQAQAQSDPTQIQTAAPVSTPTQQVAIVSPQDAAAIAAKFLNRTDLYSVQLATINGLNLYKVTFVSGDIVYVSMDGQVILSVPAPQSSPTVITASGPIGSPSRGGGGGGGDGGGGDDGGGG